MKKAARSSQVNSITKSSNHIEENKVNKKVYTELEASKQLLEQIDYRYNEGIFRRLNTMKNMTIAREHLVQASLAEPSLKDELDPLISYLTVCWIDTSELVDSCIDFDLTWKDFLMGKDTFHSKNKAEIPCKPTPGPKAKRVRAASSKRNGVKAAVACPVKPATTAKPTAGMPANLPPWADPASSTNNAKNDVA